MKQDNSNQNPWAGLSSYEDPAKSEQKLKFCGRDNETKEVTRLIDDNFFVTLYGKSGIGKTSLLNAGVFPALRREQYTPLSLRLGMTDEAQNFQDIITAAIERTLEECGGSVRVINVVDEQTDRSAIDYLWNWFARHCFLRADGQATFPVIVFDQFEEVFRHSESRQKTEVLLTQLHYLIDESHALNDCIVNGEQYYYDFNFRFVLSIREDDLYRLEDSIDNCALTALKRCRYRLRSLSEQNAEAVILVPGEGLFKKEDQKSIVDTIIDIARNKEDKSISTNVLSLICNRIFVDFQKSGADNITPSLVDSFIKGNPFERFYNEATRGFSNKEKSYIEDNLVDSTGRRNSIPESDFLLHVPKGKQLLEGDTRILQRTSTSSDGGNYRIELIHDSFCEPLTDLKEKREKQKRMRWLASVACVTLLCIGIIVFVLYQMKRINDVNWRMMENKARFVAEKASNLADEGDSYTARLLALAMLPQNLNNPNKPYVTDAEIAIRKAVQTDEYILKGHTDYVYSASYSPNGRYIVSGSRDSTIRIWDTFNGKCKKIIRCHDGLVHCVVFSPDGKRFASATEEGSIHIWDFPTCKYIKSLKSQNSCVKSMSYSPNGNLLASTLFENGPIRIWDVRTGKCIKELFNDGGKLNSVAFSPDGKRLVTSCGSNTILIWEVKTWKIITTLKGHTSFVNSAEYSPDGNMIVSASGDYDVRIWDAHSWKCITVLKGHSSYVQSASFSPDSRQIVSASWDNTIRIWDVSNNSCMGRILGHSFYVYSAVFSPDSKHIVSSSWDHTVRVWDVYSRTDSYLSNIRTITFNKDGSKILTSSPNLDNYGDIWDVNSTNMTPKSIGEFSNGTWSAYFSSKGDKILTASSDHTARIWNTKNFECLKIFNHPDSTSSDITYASFSPDEKYVITACDSTLYLWDVKTETINRTLKGHHSYIYSATFSPDGAKILSASADNSARIWDVKTGTIQKLIGHSAYLWYGSYSSDGKLIATTSADETVRIWDSASGQCLKVLRGHSAAVLSAAFSPSGQHLASSSLDQTVRIWDLSTGECIWIIPCPSQSGWCAATFSPDGKKIATMPGGKEVVIRDFLPLQQLMDETRKRFKNRQLTPEERRKYYLE